MKLSKEITTIVAFVMLVSVMIVIVPGSSATASGSVTYSPSVFSAGVQTLTVASGGTFGSGSTVYFYLSTTTSSSGIIGSYIGYYTLSGGSTTLNNAHFMITVLHSRFGWNTSKLLLRFIFHHELFWNIIINIPDTEHCNEHLQDRFRGDIRAEFWNNG